MAFSKDDAAHLIGKCMDRLDRSTQAGGRAGGQSADGYNRPRPGLIVTLIAGIRQGRLASF